MRRLYPRLEPYVQHSLAVDQRHTLHAAEYGQPDGLPALILHGGPGVGSAAWHPTLFNPNAWRVVTFDQRGCGRSLPHGAIEDNTTAHLVGDIERLRNHLGIERWLVLGGSWGATLALAYAETYPERVSALILRGAFLARERDVHWFYREGAERLLPDYWRDFIAPIPGAERDDLLAAYHRRLFGNDEIARMAAAKAWSQWEGRASTLLPDPDTEARFCDPAVALSMARIQCEYFVNGCWLDEGQLLRDAGRLAGIPGEIVHGRYDLVCPLEQALALADAWPDAALRIVPDAGHAGLEPGTTDALLAATERFAVELAG